MSALDLCHKNGVAHRDVKPQNLLLDHYNNIKVSDFGLSALPEQIKDGLIRTACGTPAYTAPEVVCRRSGGYDGAKADAWSCGVLLYFFLVGSLPFVDSNLIEMYRKIHLREYSFPEWISKPVKRIIWHLLDPNPHTRLSIELLKSTTWFKRNLQPEGKMAQFECEAVVEKGVVSRQMNAFDIISMSSGLDLSRLFEAGSAKESRMRRFTSMAKSDAILKKARDFGGRLGVKIEVMDMAEGMVMVEVEFKAADGVGDRFEEAHWVEFKAGLDEVVLALQEDVVPS